MGPRSVPNPQSYHHQQWAPEIPWIRGYATASHENELGILVELGVIGLALWISVLALITYRLWDAYRRLPDDDLCGKPLAVTAIMAMAILICTGSTVDLRFFDFSLAAVFVIFGITIGWSDRHKRAQVTARGAVLSPYRYAMAERRRCGPAPRPVAVSRTMFGLCSRHRCGQTGTSATS